LTYIFLYIYIYVWCFGFADIRAEKQVLLKCHAAAELECEFNKSLLECENVSSLIDFELSMLRFSGHDNFGARSVNGVFFAVFFMWNNVLVCRFFESGVLCGLYDKFEREVCEELSLECLVKSRVFCEPDVWNQRPVGSCKQSSENEKRVTLQLTNHWNNLSNIRYSEDLKCVARFAFVSQETLPSKALMKASVMPSMQQHIWSDLAMSILSEPPAAVLFKDRFELAISHLDDTLATQFAILNCLPSSLPVDENLHRVRFVHRLPIVAKRASRHFYGHRTSFVAALGKGDFEKALDVLALHVVTVDGDAFDVDALGEIALGETAVGVDALGETADGVDALGETAVGG
jgi:hypothetical protein